MSDSYDRPRRGEGRREPRGRSVDVEEYERVYERPSRRREFLDEYEDDRRYTTSRKYETALVPVRQRNEMVRASSEDRYYDDHALAAAPYRDERGRRQQLVIYDDEDYSDRSRSRSRSRRRHGRKHGHHEERKSKDVPTGRCWYSGKERKDADFLERNFDSSYDGIIAAAAGAAIGAMTSNRFSKEHRARNAAGAAVAGAVAFNFAENWYSRFVEDEEDIKTKAKEKVKDKLRI